MLMKNSLIVAFFAKLQHFPFLTFISMILLIGLQTKPIYVNIVYAKTYYLVLFGAQSLVWQQKIYIFPKYVVKLPF